MYKDGRKSRTHKIITENMRCAVKYFIRFSEAQISCKYLYKHVTSIDKIIY